MTKSSKQIVVIFLALILLAGCMPPAPPVTPTPTETGSGVNGAPGMGDPYYPKLGNGGYDVQSYTIALDVDPTANTVTGSTTITANATESLLSFNLDFRGLTLDSVTVNGENAKTSRTGDELKVTPAETLEADKPFTAVVTYHGTPGTITSGGLTGMGWSHGQSGAINVWGEPDAASSWFPNNNHPRDKATYRFEITVPDPWMVAATGSLKETTQNGDKTTFVWEMDQPMATYLASINIDQYELATQTGPNGLSIRNYFTTDLAPSYRSRFDALPEMIDYFDDLFGPYPFTEYGVVIAAEDGLCARTQIALETQTLSLHCPSQFMTSEVVIIHELAHMWFGDSVSLENWKDIWLKEGFATYASWLWQAKDDPDGLSQIAKNARDNYFDSSAPVADPGPDNLYSSESYTGGALVLYALQQEVGDETFFKIVQTFVERYKDGNAGTDEFITVAKDVSGQDLDAFFDAWLFSPALPELPE
jgi:aminopeptidase N